MLPSVLERERNGTECPGETLVFREKTSKTKRFLFFDKTSKIVSNKMCQAGAGYALNYLMVFRVLNGYF